MAIAELEISIDVDDKSAISGLVKLQDTFANMLDNLGAGVDELKKKWDSLGKNMPKSIPQNPFKEPSESTETFKDKLLGMGTALSASGIAMTQTLTQPIMQFGQSAFQAYNNYSKAISGVAAVTGGTTDSLKQLENMAKQIGMTTKFSSTEAANAMYFLGSAGYDTSQIISSLTDITTFASAADIDLATAAEFCTGSMSAFGMTADQTAQFTDVLALTAAKTNTDITGMSNAFKYVGPVAGAMGYSVRDAALAIGLMSNANIKGEQAGTALRGALTSLLKPSTDAAKVMTDLGISLTNTDGSAKPLQEVLTNLRTSFSGLSDVQKTQAATTLFGQESMSGMLAIINTSDESFNNLVTSLDNSEGSTKKLADTMGNNTASKFDKLKASLSTVSVELLEKLTPAITNILIFISNLVTWFSNLDSKTQTIILGFLGLLAAIGPIASILGGITTIVSVLSTVFSALAPVLAAVGGAFAAITAPVWLVIAAIAAAIAIGVLLWKNWDTIKEWCGKLWSWIKEKWDAIKDAIVNAVSRAIDWIKSINLFEIGKNMIQGMINGIVSMATAIWNAIVNTVKNTVDGVKKFLGIASPSKLFMEIGIDTGKGLSLGLDSTYDDVSNASLGLAKATTEGYQPPTNNANFNSNVTINVRSPSEIYREINFLNRTLAMGL